MKPRNKYERSIIDMVESECDEYLCRRTKGGHIKVTFEGIRNKSVIFSKSPSDHRAMKNASTDIRRAMESAGIPVRGVR